MAFVWGQILSGVFTFFGIWVFKLSIAIVELSKAIKILGSLMVALEKTLPSDMVATLEAEMEKAFQEAGTSLDEIMGGALK